MNLNLSPEMQKRFEDNKKNLESFSKALKKQWGKKIVGTALLKEFKQDKTKAPLQQTTRETNPNQIDVLVVTDIAKEKDAYRLREKLLKNADELAKKTDKNIKPYVIDTWEIRENCYDSKYEILEELEHAAIVSDDVDLLKALKISQVHKRMVLRKFEKYIVSYVAVGSLFRGDATSADIDVAITIDDTDVKKMTRAELKDKLRAIIYDMGFQASQMTGVKKQFHIQTHILTDFWDWLKNAEPVVYTFLRDGVPLFDRGIFMPWKLLLKMGRIKPSPEAMDMQMDVGERLIKRSKGKLLSILTEDLYYAMLNPAQAALMLYGIAPPTPKETQKLLDEIFVKKEKLLERKYVNMLIETRKYFKDVEHGRRKEIQGKDIDRLLKNTEEYFKRIRKLFAQLQKQANKRDVKELEEQAMTLVKDILKEEKANPGKDPLASFKRNLVTKKKVPARVHEGLKTIKDTKTKYMKGQMSHQELQKVRREANKTMKYLVEYLQRKKHYELEKLKIKFRYQKKIYGEVLMLDDGAYIIHNIAKPSEEISKAKVDKTGKLKEVKKATLEEFEKAIAKAKAPKQLFIKEKTFESLKDLFGKDVEILILG